MDITGASRRNSIRLNMAITLIVAILMGIGIYLLPWVSDDINFRLPYKDYLVNGAPFDWAAVQRRFDYMWQFDNMRLSNVMMNVFIFLPQVFSLLTSVFAVWGCLWWGLKAIKVESSLAATSLWTAAFTFCMPWIDQIYIFDFVLNYVCSSAIATLLLYKVLEAKSGAMVMLAIGLLLGVWHEGFAGPAFVGVTALMCLKPEHRTRRNTAAVIGLAIGIVWLCCVPGTESRLNSQWRPFAGRMYITYIFMAPIVLYTIVSVIRIIRLRAVDATSVLLLTSALVSLLIAIRIPLGPRIVWLGCTASFLGLIHNRYIAAARKKIFGG